MRKIVEERDQGERLDKYIFKNFQSVSRSYVKFLIDGGKVRVNGHQEKPSYKVKKADLVEWQDFLKERFLKTHKKLKIIYKDKNVLVIDKPCGIAVHPKETLKPKSEVTILDILVREYPEILKIKGERPGIVHRLDKDTSGVLVIALNEKAFQFLKEEFKERRVYKVYETLLFGRLEPKEGIINAPIGRNPKDRSKMTVVPEDEGKKAITSYKVLEYLFFEENILSLVLVYPKTGRTHQIRVHFSSIGHPLVGDKLYGPKKTNIDLERQFLHAKELKLTLPNGEERIFFSDLSSDLKKFLRKIEKPRT